MLEWHVDAHLIEMLIDGQIEHLEVSKKKANDMLQASGGDRMSAVKTYIIPAAKA